MNWFTKDKKEGNLPDLPAMPELPKLPEFSNNFEPSPRLNKMDLHQLPSFPSSITGEKISNEAVKHAVRDSFKTEEVQMPLTKEIDEESEYVPKKINVREIKSTMKNDPVYVRIDKYQDSLANFQEAKSMLLEIENILRDVKELKAREEQELMVWEQEIQETKAKLDAIDRVIFQKLE